MAEVQIGLILIFLFFFILTRRVWVRVIKDGILRIEIHLPLLALYLYDSKRKSKSKKSKKESDQLSARAYIRVIAGTLRRVKDCDVHIKRIILPLKSDKFNAMSLVAPFGYQGLIYTVITYLKSKAKKLTLSDNAIISSSDVTDAQFYVTFKLRLFELVYALLTFRRGIYEEKRARRIRYVGE